MTDHSMTQTPTYYLKALGGGAVSKHAFLDPRNQTTYLKWDLPKDDGTPGAWSPPADDIVLHQWGYHLAHPDYASVWFLGENYLAEARNTKGNHEVVVCEQTRLTHCLELLDEDWKNLALKWADLAVNIPVYLRYPDQYRAYLQTGVENPCKGFKDPLHELQATLHWRLIPDENNCEHYLYSNRAIVEAFKAVTVLNDQSRLWWQRTKDIMSHVTNAFEFAAKYDRNYPSSNYLKAATDRYDKFMSASPIQSKDRDVRIRDGIRRMQSASLWQAWGVDPY